MVPGPPFGQVATGGSRYSGGLGILHRVKGVDSTTQGVTESGTDHRLPIVILGGSDRRPVRLPDRGRDKHPLSGYKGVDVRIGDRSLVETVIDRIERSGRFHPINVVGPQSIYAPLRPRCGLIDSDGSFGDNIRIALRTLRERHPGRPIAIITCDVLPDVDTLRTLMDDYHAHAPCDIWFPMILAPDDRGALGASAWKPAYRIVPREGEEAVKVLPGHLAVVDPAGLRKKFVYRVIQLSYRTRNRPIEHRGSVLVRGVVLELLYQDLLHLLTLNAPTLTWSALRIGIGGVRELRDGRVTRARLEERMRSILITSRHRRRYPHRRVRFPIVEGLSLALDIDTEEEARAAGGQVEERSA